MERKAYTLDTKISVWERIDVPSDKVEEVKSMLEKGSTFEDIKYKLFSDEDSYFLEDLYEQLIPEDNDGQSTLELIERVDDQKQPLNNQINYLYKNGE